MQYYPLRLTIIHISECSSADSTTSDVLVKSEDYHLTTSSRKNSNQKLHLSPLLSEKVVFITNTPVVTQPPFIVEGNNLESELEDLYSHLIIPFLIQRKFILSHHEL